MKRRALVRRFHLLDTSIKPALLGTQLYGTVFGGFHKLHHFPAVDSTNTVAMEAASRGVAEGSVYLADEQTGGRGRGGHRWHSPPGSGIYVSAVLRPKLPATEVLWLSLITGIAAHDAILRVTGFNVDLRWPNDIMAGEKKLGGILTEISTEGERVRHAVLGVGLNVNQPEFPPQLSAIATSLRIVTERVWPRQPILVALLKSLHKGYAALQKGRAAKALLARFEECSSYARGAAVAVDDAGSGSYSGVTAGLDERGFLRVNTGSGMRTVISGGVRKI